MLQLPEHLAAGASKASKCKEGHTKKAEGKILLWLSSWFSKPCDNKPHRDDVKEMLDNESVMKSWKELPVITPTLKRYQSSKNVLLDLVYPGIPSTSHTLAAAPPEPKKNDQSIPTRRTRSFSRWSVACKLLPCWQVEVGRPLRTLYRSNRAYRYTARSNTATLRYPKNLTKLHYIIT